MPIDKKIDNVFFQHERERIFFSTAREGKGEVTSQQSGKHRNLHIGEELESFFESLDGRETERTGERRFSY